MELCCFDSKIKVFFLFLFCGELFGWGYSEEIKMKILNRSIGNKKFYGRGLMKRPVVYFVFLFLNGALFFWQGMSSPVLALRQSQ